MHRHFFYYKAAKSLLWREPQSTEHAVNRVLVRACVRGVRLCNSNNTRELSVLFTDLTSGKNQVLWSVGVEQRHRFTDILIFCAHSCPIPSINFFELKNEINNLQRATNMSNQWTIFPCNLAAVTTRSSTNIPWLHFSSSLITKWPIDNRSRSR